VIPPKGVFLINAFLEAAGCHDSQIVKPDTSIIAGLPAVLLVFLGNRIKA
jgi:hypothetical protein